MVLVNPSGNTMDTNGIVTFFTEIFALFLGMYLGKKDNLDYVLSLDMEQPDVFVMIPTNGLPHRFYKGLNDRSHSVMGAQDNHIYHNEPHLGHCVEGP